MGGDWFSTTAEGECSGAAKPGDQSGCTWKIETPSEVKFINQSCLDNRVDAVVEKLGAECFKGRIRPPSFLAVPVGKHALLKLT